MNDRISEFSQNLAPQSDKVEFRQIKSEGISVPFWAYLLGFLVFVAFIAVKSDIITKKDDKKGGGSATGGGSFGGKK
jgi:flagellar biosynthesis/type III secretory pathway M-ring protein FliF/YscJ